MKTTIEIPAHLPQPPAPPEGMEWQYRGMGWEAEKPNLNYAYTSSHRDNWVSMLNDSATCGSKGRHYLEAVPIAKPRFVAGEDSCGSDRNFNSYNVDDLRPEYRDGRSHTGRIVIYSDTPELRDRIVSLLNNSPEPIEAPQFDWSALWSELPSWIGWVAMDANGTWSGYTIKPVVQRCCFLSPSTEYAIPAEFAPPAATDWKTSLTKRP